MAGTLNDDVYIIAEKITTGNLVGNIVGACEAIEEIAATYGKRAGVVAEMVSDDLRQHFQGTAAAKEAANWLDSHFGNSPAATAIIT